MFPKQTPGEHFDGLDMITKLLAPRGKTSASGPLIQVLGNRHCVIYTHLFVILVSNQIDALQHGMEKQENTM